MVIGTFAYCGSGQDTLADSICDFYNFKKYSLGDLLREIAKKRGVKATRTELQSIRNEYDEKYGRCYFPNKIIQRIESDKNNNVIITGIRTLEEYEMFKQKLGMIFVFVYADKEKRLNRMLARNSEKDEKSLELIKRNLQQENLMFDYEKLEKLWDYKFDFNMSLDDYKKNEAQIIKEIVRCMEDKNNG